MPIQTEEQIINFSKDQMFDLVSDIDSYSEFLPWCENSNIISKVEEDDSDTILIADLDSNSDLSKEEIFIVGM